MINLVDERGAVTAVIAIFECVVQQRENLCQVARGSRGRDEHARRQVVEPRARVRVFDVAVVYEIDLLDTLDLLRQLAHEVADDFDQRRPNLLERAFEYWHWLARVGDRLRHLVNPFGPISARGQREGQRDVQGVGGEGCPAHEECTDFDTRYFVPLAFAWREGVRAHLVQHMLASHLKRCCALEKAACSIVRRRLRAR